MYVNQAILQTNKTGPWKLLPSHYTTSRPYVYQWKKHEKYLIFIFFARLVVFQASHCVVTKVEVPNSVLTCNMKKKIVTVSVYQAV